ncbi:hypothetical protein TIFTF001_051286 [Ficus carica]|uniref:Uncharacterized protein n=1 Tax=Ficus carica TaxID=3494 RepID=A0AA88CN52_FICCA|nr:hypothetical protein TIFTF001_051286 [Ficus carica]
MANITVCTGVYGDPPRMGLGWGTNFNKWGIRGYGELASNEESMSPTPLLFRRDGDRDDDGFGGGDGYGDEKAFSGLTPPSCHHYVLLHS